MSSIIFDAELSTDKLNAEIKKSNQTIGSWVRGIEDGSIKMDKAIEKTTKNTKEAVKEQQALIKSLEADIKRIQGLLTDKLPKEKNKGIFSELTRMKENLAVEEKKLIELQNQGTQQDEKEVVSKNKIIEALKKWGLGLFSIGAALKVAKDIIMSTEGSADKFKETVALLTGGLQGLYRTIVTGSWDQLINNIVNAARATRDLKQATNELEHITAGGIIKRADLRGSLEKARVNAAETTDPVERAKFLNEAMDYQKQITELNVGEIKKRLKIDEDYYFKLTGHSKEYYDYLLTQIPSIAKDYEGFYSRQEGYQLRLNDLKYLETAQFKGLSVAQEKEKDQLQKAVFVLEDFKILQNELSKPGQFDEYIKGIGEMRDEVATGDLALVYMTRQKTTAEKADKKAREDAIKAAAEAAKIESKIAKEKELFTKAFETGNVTEQKAIGIRIGLLEKELSVRQQLLEAAIGATIVRETPISKIAGLKPLTLLPGGLKIPNTLAGGPDSKLNEELYISGTAMLSEAGKANQKAKDAKYDKDAEESLKKQLELRDEIVNAVASLVNQIGQQIGLEEKSMALLNAGLDAFTALATQGAAGIPQAALAMISGIITQIPSAASRFEAQIGHINSLLEEQARLIELSEQVGGQEQTRKNTLDFLKEKERLAKAEYERLQQSADQHLDLLGWRQKKANEANAAWKETTNEIENSNAALDEYLTGTTTSAMADAIMQGFQDGETSAADFADTFNGFMVQAINSALKDALLTDLNPWYKQLAADMESGGELTDKEKADLKIWYDTIIANQKARRDAAEQISGVNLDTGVTSQSNQALSMGISRNISESTGTEIAALFRRFADDNRATKDYTLLGMNNLTKIEANTYGSMIELQKYLHYLENISVNTKQVPVAGF